MNQIVKLASAEIELYESGLTVTRYDKREVIAWPEEDEIYKQRAMKHGYGEDIFLMSREHELTHHLLAEWLGLGFSPTLMAVSANDQDPNWGIEEAAVLAVQAFARSRGVDIVALAIERSRK